MYDIIMEGKLKLWFKVTSQLHSCMLTTIQLMHSVIKQARIPVSTPPMNDPPIAAGTFTSGFKVRLRQISTVADVSLTGHWEINLNG